MSQCQPRPPKSQLENRQAANRTTAIVVPALLIGIVSYITWVVVVLIGGKCCLCSRLDGIGFEEKLLVLNEGAKHLDRIKPSFSVIASIEDP
jgi:hypothetical protein